MLMKKIPRILASSFLKLTLTTFVLTLAIASLVNSPATIKSAFKESGIYDNLVSDLLDKSLEESDDNSAANQAAFQQSAKAALTPETVQSATEQIIDALPAWLSGDSDHPNFRIDLTDAKARFISTAGDLAANHVNGLPACTTAQERELAAKNEETQILDLSCRPRGTTAATARQEVETQLANQDFLKDPVLTPETTLFKDENNGPTNWDSTSQVYRDIYRAATNAPWILLIISLLLGVAVFFLSETKRQGAKALARTVATVGASLLLITLVSNVLFDRLLKPGGPVLKDSGDSLQASLASVFTQLSNRFNQTVLKYAIIYVVIGVGALLAIKFLWKESAVTVPKAAKVVKKTV